MINHKTYVLIIWLVATFHVTAQPIWLQVITNAPDFSKLTYKEAAAATESDVQEISSGRKFSPEYVSNIVYQLRSEQLSNSNKVLAVWILHELQTSDTNAIEYLVKNIDLKGWLDRAGSMPRWDKYPAQEALLSIGAPAMDPTLKYLSMETNQVRRYLMCDVLAFADRKANHLNQAESKKFAQNQVKQKIAAESNSTKKANLELALKELEK